MNWENKLFLQWKLKLIRIKSFNKDQVFFSI